MKKLFFLILIFFNYQIINTAQAKVNCEKKYSGVTLRFQDVDDFNIFFNQIKKENNFTVIGQSCNLIIFKSKNKFSKNEIRRLIEDLSIEGHMPIASLPEIKCFWTNF